MPVAEAHHACACRSLQAVAAERGEDGARRRHQLSSGEPDSIIPDLSRNDVAPTAADGVHRAGLGQV